MVTQVAKAGVGKRVWEIWRQCGVCGQGSMVEDWEGDLQCTLCRNAVVVRRQEPVSRVRKDAVR